eukprot:1185693-Prorocentrum_minimum.AAC.2
MGTLAPLTGIRQHGNKQLRVALKAKTRHIRRTCKRQVAKIVVPEDSSHIDPTSAPHQCRIGGMSRETGFTHLTTSLLANYTWLVARCPLVLKMDQPDAGNAGIFS